MSWALWFVIGWEAGKFFGNDDDICSIAIFFGLLGIAVLMHL